MRTMIRMRAVVASPEASVSGARRTKLDQNQYVGPFSGVRGGLLSRSASRGCGYRHTYSMSHAKVRVYSNSESNAGRPF